MPRKTLGKSVNNLLKNKVSYVRDKVQIIELLKWQGIKKDAKRRSSSS